ncbi:hypothetical protein C8R43DRAFT_1078304 [Mycena crocata]|nr:hypothetical protein C8R43DRAFT_1078304 [Mycena crocata]
MAGTRNGLQGVKPHDSYFFDGGDLHIIAEDREFRVHRYFFERDSARFRALLAPGPSPGQPRQGSSHLTAIKLQDVTAKDFEKFLWVFYNPTYSLYDATVSDWSCILRMGHDWQFAEVEKLAVRELEKTSISPIERVALYQKHDVSEDLLIPHYAALCMRGFPLDFDESEKLGMTTVVLINQAMHSIHTPQNGSGGSSPINPINAAVIAKIMTHIEKKQPEKNCTALPRPGGTSNNGDQKRPTNSANGAGAKSGQSSSQT